MSESFNLNRAALLFRSIIIANKRDFIRLIFIIGGIFFVMSCFNIAKDINGPLTPVGRYISWDLYFSLTFPMIYASGFMYSKYRDKLHINTSQMLPASINEKFFVQLFISLILIPLLVVVLLIILSSFFWFFAIVARVIFEKQAYYGVMDILDISHISVANVIDGSDMTVIDMSGMTIIESFKTHIKASPYIDAVMSFSLIKLVIYGQNFALLLALHSTCCLSSVLPKRYSWTPFYIFALTLILPMIGAATSYYFVDHGDLLTSYFRLVLHYGLIALALSFWITSYFKFRKIVING